MQTMKYTNCKWCGCQLDARNGVECYRCWNLRSAIESNIELASQILAHLTKRSPDLGADVELEGKNDVAPSG